MGFPVMLVENLYSQTQFASHVLLASEEASRSDVWRVATGRRSPADRWSTQTANVAAWAQVHCDQARPADMVALDRGHNLAGVQVLLQSSPDGAAWTTQVTSTIPSTAGVSGSVDATHGVTTDEGAWVKRFTQATALYWRLWIPAMGAGLVPHVVGLWLGRSWQPAHYLGLPYDDHGQQLLAQETDPTPAGWRGSGPTARVRDGELPIALANDAEYDTVRYHIREHFHARRRPMWILHDANRAERAVLAVPPPGRLSFRYEQGWHSRQAVVPWVEHEPRMDT